jgi:hypothetical protein
MRLSTAEYQALSMLVVHKGAWREGGTVPRPMIDAPASSDSEGQDDDQSDDHSVDELGSDRGEGFDDSEEDQPAAGPSRPLAKHLYAPPTLTALVIILTFRVGRSRGVDHGVVIDRGNSDVFGGRRGRGSGFLT